MGVETEEHSAGPLDFDIFDNVETWRRTHQDVRINIGPFHGVEGAIGTLIRRRQVTKLHRVLL